MTDEPITTAAQMREAAAQWHDKREFEAENASARQVLSEHIRWFDACADHHEAAAAAIRAIPIAPPDDAMVERVARALCRDRHLCWSIVADVMEDNIDGQADEFRSLARAAIAAMGGGDD